MEFFSWPLVSSAFQRDNRFDQQMLAAASGFRMCDRHVDVFIGVSTGVDGAQVYAQLPRFF